ncbi:MAG: DUF167 domain-containing protein [Patescibacteria group bacterium]
MLTKYIEKLANNKEIYLRIKVLPGAGETAFLDKMADGTLKIAVAAPPEKGKANKELIDFLAEQMGVRKYQIKVASGAGARIKLVKISR